MKSLRLTIFFLLAIIAEGTGQHLDKATHRYFNNFDDPSVNSAWINSNTIILSNDSSGNYFSRTDAMNPYSAGIEVEIPPDLKRKSFRITVSCNVKMLQGTNNQLVISISKNDSSIFWEGVQIHDSTLRMVEQDRNATKNLNGSGPWYSMNKSTLIPGNIPVDSKIKIFIWNADGKSETDVDQMEISFTETTITSFLPR